MNSNSINSIRKKIRLILFLLSKPRFEVNELSSKIEMPYQSLNKLLKGWLKEGLIKRERKEVLILGGSKYEYELTKRGTELLKELKTILQEGLDELNYKALENKIVNLDQELEKILDDLKIVITKKKREQLISKIINLFES